MQFHSSTIRSIFLSALFAVAPFAHADFDISPSAFGGALKTNAFQDADSTFVGGVRVFHFGLGADGPFFAQDPGFHPLTNGGIAANQALTVTVASPLQYWNGNGRVSFGALPNGESLKLQNGSFSLTAGSMVPSGTLTIATTDAFSEFDHHLGSTLQPGGANDPADGLYLTSLILHNPGGTLADSLPFWIIYNSNATDDAEINATLAVRDAFAPGTAVAGVPEPTVLSLVGIGCVLGLRRRR